MNDAYGCNFDVFFPNWEEHQKKLLTKKIRLLKEANDPEESTFPFMQQRIQDAKKDLQKREYLKEADIREAERLVEIGDEMKKINSKLNIEKQLKVNKCLDYIQKKVQLIMELETLSFVTYQV